MLDISTKLKPGKYIIAVSGGVDSMVLLELLAKSQKPKAKYEFVVAHFNHQIRSDSSADERLVKTAAKKYGLEFEVGRSKLGTRPSEDKARKARYEFLRSVRKKHQAKAIITAHHQDDLLETAVLNILRGTGRRGLTAISENPEIIRPLLAVPKQKIIEYANQQRLSWHEDSTNRDDSYLRNYVRNRILNNLSAVKRNKLLKNIEKVAITGIALDSTIATISHSLILNGKIVRQAFSELPPEAANEMIIYWLRQRKFMAYDKKMVERLSLALKTARPNTRHRIANGLELVLGQKYGRFESKL